MNIKIEQPTGYMEGAYKLTAELSSTETAFYKKIPLAFKIPVLPKRIFHTESEYVVACTDDEGTYLRGRFKNGVWITHFYTNGVEEKDNPTSVEKIVACVEKEINKVLDTIKDIFV